MQIQVREIYTYPYYLSTKIDGICNHFGEREERDQENEYGTQSIGMYCLGCGAEYNDLDGKFIV